MEIERQRLFVDMDGTLAVFTPTKRLEDLYEKGYFANLEPISNVIDAVRLVVREHPEIEVNVLSAHLSDSPYALNEKNEWLDKNLPEIDKAHRIFPPCGTDKKDYIPNGLRENDFLLDDYTHNLNQWEPPARGIKLLNGINHTHGTWQKDQIRFDRQPQDMAASIVSVMEGKMRVNDNKPQLANTIDRNVAAVAQVMNQTIAEVLQQRGNILQLQWHFPSGASEYSVHSLDVNGKGINTGNYFEIEEKEACESCFEERSSANTETAERDFSGFSYPCIKGKVLFNEPIGSEKAQEHEKEQEVYNVSPLKLTRITSFVREILLKDSSIGGKQYFGYCNGEQETDGYDTLDELIEDNERYTKLDIAVKHTSNYNVCSLYYNDGTVKRLNGNDYNVGFAKMPAAKLKEFTDNLLKSNMQSVSVKNAQTPFSEMKAPAYRPSPHVTEQQIEIAKSTNLVAFLQQRGYDLQPSGGWYRWKEHPSFSVNEDGRWAWHSRNLKGGPIDFLMKCENMSFVEAVEQLAGSISTYVPNLASKRKEDIEQPKPPMQLPPADAVGARAKAYLIKTRGLDPQIVKELMVDKIIYESADYHNVVFVGYDKEGVAKYAAQRGTITNAEKPFKRDVLNSDKSFAFQLRGTSATKVAVFEAPIDAISHKCIQKIFKQDYTAINRIALGGVSDKALKRYIEDNPQITDIAFATDNDSAGHEAAESLMQKYKDLGYNVSRITPMAKDFNQDLTNIREELAAERGQGTHQDMSETIEEPIAEMELG